MKGDKLGLSITKKNPKPNAPTYELRTVKEIFDMLTRENMHRFFKDFKMGMSLAVNTRDLLKSTADNLHPEVKDVPGKDMVKMEVFKRIDD